MNGAGRGVNDTKKKRRLKHRRLRVQEPVKQYRDKTTSKQMYRLLLVYLVMGYEREGEVIENMLKSKNKIWGRFTVINASRVIPANLLVGNSSFTFTCNV